MSDISASVTSQPISASVSSGSISASVPGASPVAATVAGGVGPVGPAGPPGSNALSNLNDVEIASPSNGDLLRYSNSKWRNYSEQSLVLDGENF